MAATSLRAVTRNEYFATVFVTSNYAYLIVCCGFCDASIPRNEYLFMDTYAFKRSAVRTTVATHFFASILCPLSHNSVTSVAVRIRGKGGGGEGAICVVGGPVQKRASGL